ncbi:glycosyltransferase family 4 protein [Parafrankia elaeagni]|uniref:glycosyltransferase family 4 protein n=1 Tax=Parafrankia elaeagni TaxID=222534 RepID=UPI00039F35A4|nr:glycosyltransferase family 4 protein [Parafrankia elaeagni]
MTTPPAQRIPTEDPAAKPRVVLLSPSRGLGGGIERYLGTVEEHLRAGGADVRRFDLRTSPASLTARIRGQYVLRTLASLYRMGQADSVVAGHASLALVAWAGARLVRASRVPVLFYGSDIWGGGQAQRRVVTRARLLYPVTISSFSAGALAVLGPARILPPSVPPRWRTMLLAEAAQRRPPAGMPTVLTVFRLGVWQSKGLSDLVEAVTAAQATTGPVRLVVAGQGPAPSALREFVAGHDNVELHESPDDAALARLYGAADVFALCTRTRATSPASGEGYGIVLMEAQLAGCAVVGPAVGGSRDAYLDGVTGRTPVDESPAALAEVLRELLDDRARLTQIGEAGTTWARAATDPAGYTRLVMATLTGAVPGTPVTANAPGAAAPVTTGKSGK